MSRMSSNHSESIAVQNKLISNLRFSFLSTENGVRGSLFKSPPFVRRLWNGTKILQIWKQPHRAWLFKHGSLFVPVLNFICRSDGGGNKQGRLVGGELSKRPPYPENRFGAKVLQDHGSWPSDGSNPLKKPRPTRARRD